MSAVQPEQNSGFLRSPQCFRLKGSVGVLLCEALKGRAKNSSGGRAQWRGPNRRADFHLHQGQAF